MAKQGAAGTWAASHCAGPPRLYRSCKGSCGGRGRMGGSMRIPSKSRALLASLVLAGTPLVATLAPAAEAAAATAPIQRFGRPLGLPRDGATLYLPDAAYPRFPLPKGEEAYGDIDGLRAKALAGEITAISRKSRDDGNQYWGRITGTPYDKMTRDWVEKQFRSLGLEDVRQDPLKMPPLWYPSSWKAEMTVDGSAIPLKSVFPLVDTVGTAPAGVTAEAVWVGLGTDADFLGRDVRGKAVFIYSVATPGGRDHSAQWNGAIKRANAAGAAMVLVAMGFPGDAVTEPEAGAGTTAPTFTVSSDEIETVRTALGAGKKVQVHLTAEIGERAGLETATVWGTLPGATDEKILIMAHTDAFFEGALDNASGIGMMLEIARHYAAIPQSQRRRTLVFLTTPDHHQGFVGIKNVHDTYDFSKVALIVNCEHPSQTLIYLLDSGIMTANSISARRWYAGGSAAFKALVTDSFIKFNVSTYAVPERRPGGELSFLFDKAPSFHIIDHVIYHTTLDTLALIPAWGIEDAGRAYLKIIDGVNRMSLAEIKAP